MLATALLLGAHDATHHSRSAGQSTHVVRVLPRPHALLFGLLKLEVLLESDDVDAYYRWVKSRGGMDFVEEFVRPGEEDGLHLDIEANYAPTVITDRIAPENVHRLIARIQSCRSAAA